VPPHRLLTIMNFSFRKPNLRLLSFAGLLVLSGALSYAQAPKPAETPKKILMWKATSGSNVVYLLGSIHLGSKDMYPLPKVVDDAFARSKALVVEVDINGIDQTDMQQQIMTLGMYPGDDTLWTHLSKPTADLTKKFFAKYDIPEVAAAKFKPWMAGIMASVLPMMKAGMDPNLGIDKHFLDLAKGKKKIEQAETADFQLKLLSSLPDNLADVYLSWTIGEISKSKEQDLKLEKLWKSGDADALNTVMSEHPKELDGLMRSMLEDRNPHMADVAEKYLKNGGGPCFFVVGAGHLIGKEGVIAILQSRGYTIYQMSAQ
jgi:uncharacterized protein YbaP (TraB family)